MKKSTIFTIVIGIAGIYFVDSNIVIGVILIVWAFLRFYGYGINQAGKGILSVLKNSNKTDKANILFVVSVNIAGILSSKEVGSILEKLKDRKVIDFDNKDVFIKNLLEIYKKKFKKEQEYTDKKTGKIYLWEKIEFNIKTNLMWEDRVVNFSDVIYHEFSIPFKYEEGGDDDFSIFHDIDGSLKVRFLMVNGILKVQLGRFNKDLSPKIIKDGGLAVYQEWLTVSEFPVMYLTQIFPDKYLNFSMYATESYNHMGVGEKTDWTRDWKEVSKERAGYNELYNLDDDDQLTTSNKNTIDLFGKKGRELIDLQNLVNDNPPDDSGWYTPEWMEDNSICYSSDYARIKIYDLNENRERFEKHYSSDYYHEQP